MYVVINPLRQNYGTAPIAMRLTPTHMGTHRHRVGDVAWGVLRVEDRREGGEEVPGTGVRDGGGGVGTGRA